MRHAGEGHFDGWSDPPSPRVDYPEDLILRWIIRNPRASASILFSAVSGFPFLIGLVLGAWIF